MEKTRQYDVVILGGGWTGLLTAYFALKKKKTVLVIEKEHLLGGFAKTIKFKNFKFDIGGHRIFFDSQSNLNFIKQFTDKWINHERKSSIFYNNVYIDYPPSLNSILKIHKIPVFQIIKDFFVYRRKKEYTNNLESWLKHMYGETLFRIYFRDYTEKVWGIPCAELSPCWAENRIGRMSFLKFIKEFLTGKSDIKENSKFFLYPSEGIESLIAGLEKQIINQNGHIIKGVKEYEIFNHKDDNCNYLVKLKNKDIYAKEVISTVKINHLIKHIQNLNKVPSFKEHYFKYRNLIIVSLEISKEYVTSQHWLYFPQKNMRISRLFEPKNWSKELAEQGSTLLCAELMCGDNDELWTSTNLEVIKKVKQDLQKLKLVNSQLIKDVSVFRFKDAYPIYSLKDQQNRMQIIKELEEICNFHIAGRQGTFSYLDMEECFVQAKSIVEKLS